MKITKIVHSTLLFEYADVKVLIDPGKMLRENYESLTGLSYLIISDIHQDHYDKEGIIALLKNNHDMKVIVTESVKLKLEADAVTILKSLIIIDADCELKIGGINWCFGLEKHVAPYKDLIKPEDILWYQVEDKYFGSGDTYKLPKGQVELMGLNVIGPFGSMEKFIDYALQAKPKKVINIHDGFLNKDFTVGFYGFVKKHLGENGIEYQFLNDGDSIEI